MEAVEIRMEVMMVVVVVMASPLDCQHHRNRICDFLTFEIYS